MSINNPVGSTTSVPTSSSSGNSLNQITNPNGQLGQNAFLQLMVTQMQYQDPLNPSSSTNFLSQLAQYTSLEQMTNLATTESSVLQSIQTMTQDLSVNMSQQMIGKTVTVQDAKGNPITGTVQGVKMSSSGDPQLVVQGSSYPLNSVSQIG